MQPLIAIVASGFNVSGDIDLTKRRLEAIFCPVISSATALMIQGNVDATSANFARVRDFRSTPMSGDLQFIVAAGSSYVMMPAGFLTPAYARIELGMIVNSLQTDNRTFVLQTSRRQ